MSSKNKNLNADSEQTKLTPIVNTENEFAAEFGEGLYGGQAREAFKQQQQSNKNNEASK